MKSKLGFNFQKYIFLTIFIFIPFSSNSEIIIVDADTIKLKGKSIRLYGIDAPERTQTCENSENVTYDCGAKATNALIKFIKLNADKKVNCNYTNKDRYGRFIGECHIGKININRWLVKKGWAIAYRQYSLKYIKDEKIARINNSGIWKGKFIEPWKWRKGERLKSKSNGTKDNCFIKGNISSNGKKIYHIQSGKYYNQTKISTVNGEMWFCSEKEAVENGWRKSKK